MTAHRSWRPKLVGVDLDGTLLGEDGTVSPRTAQAVARVEAAGVPVVIVTGRPPRWLTAVAEQLDHRGIAVCANGALIWDLHTGALVASDPLDPAILADVTARLRGELPEATFAVEYGDSFTHEQAYPVRWDRNNPQVRVGELAELLSRHAAKLLVRHPTYGPDQLLAASQALLGESVTLTHSSYDGLLEISAAGVTKATGLARVAQTHGVEPEDVLAFGDMPNDLPMFGWAGRAVAVANAHPAVLAAADERTGSNAEDGVAAYLERFFPPRRAARIGKDDVMTTPRSYPEGVTSWVDLDVPDLDPAQAFYGELFGWTFTRVTPPDAPFQYLIAQLDGRDATAIGGPSDAAPAWNTYLAVDDADEAATRIQAAGGEIAQEPADAGEGGRSASCVDPGGAPFRLWQAGRRLGAQIVNTPGAWNFSDLYDTDPRAAGAFYTEVFGWVIEDMGFATMIKVPGYGEHLATTSDPDIHRRQAMAPPGFADVIGGLVQTDPGEPAHWRVTFTVADRDATAEAVRRLGGQVVSSADTEWTRQAVVRDPQGALFTASQFTPPA